MTTLQTDSLVDRYFHEIEDSVGLSSEAEVEMARLIKEGNEEALSNLVKANLRFVVSVAKQYQNLGLPLSDLINEGNLGLMIAAKRFDGTKGFKFISYAVWWIRQSILQALAEQSRIVRLPLNRIGELTRVNKVLNKLEQRLGRPPEVDEIADELEVEPGDMELLMRLAQRPVSLEMPCDDSEPDRTYGDLIPDDNVPCSDEVLSDEQLRGEVQRAMHALTEGEARVLKMYYGLEGHEAMTLEEIGAYVGRTRERVRQIKEKALQKLRHPARSDTLKEYYAD
ncbi:MAG: sigma-70 family RNA polymerase sigma factor [Candidatus Latescibacterota bacterium]|jgi:RNA polymerase primary sigma factor|nr:RNA polymerase sigma factor RpoD/SigA [Candidatus Latescibacterota bacterium]MEE2727954.1 RNA polymerase sigma factor RpoD/SigA [Candidatus Latescibacterota bacterium]